MVEGQTPPHSGSAGSPEQQVLHATARALAESATIEEAAPRMIEAVCGALGWKCGSIWEVNRARNALRCVGTWAVDDPGLAEFLAATRASSFPSGIGLPGRVWENREPVWIADVTRDTNFPRSQAAEHAGLHSAFGLPIRQGRRVAGVLEFFSHEVLEPTSAQLAMMATICSQISLYVERRWAAEDLDRFFSLSLDLFCIATFDGYFVRLNPAWQTLLGYQEEELRASPFMSFVHPDDQVATVEAVSALSTGGHVINFENRYRTKDGSYRWLQWTSTPYVTQGLIYATARDISSAKEAADALRGYARVMEQAKPEQEETAARLSQLVQEHEVTRERA